MWVLEAVRAVLKSGDAAGKASIGMDDGIMIIRDDSRR